MSQRFSSAMKWSFLGEAASKLIRPLVFLFLGRFLLPEDFGVVASAMMVIAFSQVFWEAGMSKVVIQRKENLTIAASTAFWINILLAVPIIFLIWSLSDNIGLVFFQSEVVGDVLRVMCLYIIFVSLGSIHVAIMQRDLKFKKLFWIRLIALGVPALVSLPLAIYGWGYWALISATVIGELVSLIIVWHRSIWRPQFIFSPGVARELFGFGFWVSISALLTWFHMWGDALFVGIYLTGHDLGIYRYGTMAIASIFSVLAGPILPVLYSYLSGEFRKQADNQTIISNVLMGERIMASGLFSAALFIFYFADFFIPVILGDDWLDLSNVVSLVALASAIAFTVSLKQEVYRASGRPDIETKIMTISLATRLVFYIFTIQYGLVVFLYFRIISTIIGVFNHLTFAKVILGIPYHQYFRQNGRIFILFILFTFLGTFLSSNNFTSLSELLLLIVLFGCYVSILALSEFKNFKGLAASLASVDAKTLTSAQTVGSKNARD